MKCNGKISSVLSIQRNAVISLLIFCSNQIFSWSKGTIFLGFLGTWVTTVYLKYQLSVHSTLYFGHAKSFLPRKSSYVRYMQKLLYQLLNSMHVCRRLHFSYPLGAAEDQGHRKNITKILQDTIFTGTCFSSRITSSWMGKRAGCHPPLQPPIWPHRSIWFVSLFSPHLISNIVSLPVSSAWLLKVQIHNR